ncbi:heavy-metal-associated domain-containing protein [Streptomyces achromogenes]|jgi:copper chaperone CopZ|uniref:Heavy-metal-associated domain-containing protein n=1 Tax=Streptomyces achromogenes TaxID=67255 RepID=A0ABZ1KX87_STRAH|nr:heavy-metal-associated domain-containing protein [Streptomyces achromogenes]
MSSCCSPDGSCHSGSATTRITTDATRTVYAVTGMTCGHCEAAVTKAVSGVDGVLSVEVDVKTGRVTVLAEDNPDDALIARAVDEAGYALTGRAA